jgi:hypothetical protein
LGLARFSPNDVATALAILPKPPNPGSWRFHDSLLGVCESRESPNPDEVSSLWRSDDARELEGVASGVMMMEVDVAVDASEGVGVTALPSLSSSTSKALSSSSPALALEKLSFEVIEYTEKSDLDLPSPGLTKTPLVLPLPSTTLSDSSVGALGSSA